MKYFRIEIAPVEDLDVCCIEDIPKEIGNMSHRFHLGRAFGAKLPERSRAYMDKGSGMKLASLIPNTDNMLLVHRTVKDVIEAEARGGTIEYLPVSIYNHKKRLASDDYFIVHPVGAVDCLDLPASDIKYLDGEVVTVRKMILSPEKLEEAPDLFRVEEDPAVYLISERLLEKLRNSGFELTNFYATLVESSK